MQRELITRDRVRYMQLSSKKEPLTEIEEAEILVLAKHLKINTSCTYNSNLKDIIYNIETTYGTMPHHKTANAAFLQHRYLKSLGLDTSGNKTRDRLRAKLGKLQN